MVQKVTWLVGARITFDDAITYLEHNFTEKEIEKFADKVQQKLLIIKSNPKLGNKAAKKSNVYKTVIHKRIILIYRYKPLKKEIELLTFWNTLQNPKKLRF